MDLSVKIQAGKDEADWVTSDTEKLDQYVSDPLCSFVFTVNAYYQMFCGIQQTQKRESIYMIPKTLPIFMVSGSDDPVGGFGKGVRKIYEKYRAAGIQDVTLRLYAGDRHEILNETDRSRYIRIYTNGCRVRWKYNQNPLKVFQRCTFSGFFIYRHPYSYIM